MRKLRNEELDRLSPTAFKAAPKKPFCIMLDNIRSMNNVGSAFRTADAFLANHLVLSGITACPPHREINKTALGATDTVSWTHFRDPLEAVRKLKDEGWKVVAIEQADNSLPLNQFTPESDEKYCFVFGNEVFGVDDEIVSAADLVIEIPQYGSKHSLNISVSIGIVCWHFIINCGK